MKLRLVYSFLSLFLVQNALQAYSADPVPQSQLFDYSAAIIGFSNEIIATQEQLDLINAQLAMLQSIAGYGEVVTPAINSLMSQQVALFAAITDLQSVLNEMTNIMNLDTETQAQLYYFYTVLRCSYIEFMLRMPFNYQSALADPTILVLLTDSTNSSDAKKIVAELIYQNYPVSLAHIHSLARLYSYIL